MLNPLVFAYYCEYYTEILIQANRNQEIKNYWRGNCIFLEKITGSGNIELYGPQAYEFFWMILKPSTLHFPPSYILNVYSLIVT